MIKKYLISHRSVTDHIVYLVPKDNIFPSMRKIITIFICIIDEYNGCWWIIKDCPNYVIEINLYCFISLKLHITHIIHDSNGARLKTM